MTTQLHLANVIVAGRTHTDQDPALLRTVELAREQERRERGLRRYFRH
jgi:hypothetical protein